MLALSGIGYSQAVAPDTVFVNVSVTGPKKAPAPGLKAENFQILEDGVEQKITYFAGSDGLWDFNILLANSQLLPGKAERVSASIRAAIETFKKTSNPVDRIKVEELHFGSDGMFAAIDRNLVDLQKTTNPRKALIVVTDGFDMPGGDASTALIEYSRKLNIPIYFFFTPIVVGSDPDKTVTGARGANYNEAEGEQLFNIASQTGGALIHGDALQQLEAQMKVFAEELRSNYLLGFKSTNDAKDDKWRKLKVKVNPPAGQKLEASSKAKYFVPKPLK